MLGSACLDGSLRSKLSVLATMAVLLLWWALVPGVLRTTLVGGTTSPENLTVRSYC